MTFVILALGYLLGSLPTAYIVGRITRDRDIRELGDGNMGAQNAYRQLGAGAGITVFLIDVAKGAIAILLAQRVGLSEFAVLSTGVAAVIGHNFPFFLGWRGGRGESTTIGVLLVLVTQPLLIMGTLALVTLIFTKNVIIASAVLFAPLWLICLWAGVQPALIVYSVAMPCLVAFTHYLRARQRAPRPVG